MIARRRATHAYIHAGVLCLVAGYVDAFGYIMLGHVFAANMTGNTVLLAISLAHGDLPATGSYILTLGAFFAGAIMAAFIRHILLRDYPPLILAGLLLCAAGRSHSALFSLTLLALAMGLQGASISRFGDISLHTVVVTGTIVKLAEGVSARLWGAASRAKQIPNEGLALYLIAWLSYAAGAGAGALALGALRLPLVIPALLLFLAALDLATTPHGRKASG